MKTCYLCVDRSDGFYILAVANFETEADRQFANKQREQAKDEGRWFSANAVTDKQFTITQLPYKVEGM